MLFLAQVRGLCKCGAPEDLLHHQSQRHWSCPRVVAAAAQSDSPAFAKFKSEMMPKVGQRITVVGTLHEGKQGFWLAFNNWGAYIYAVKKSGAAKQNDLYAHFRSGQTLRVTGTLRHFVEPTATRKDEQHAQYAHPPEHFFFDADEVEMSRWSPTP